MSTTPVTIKLIHSKELDKNQWQDIKGSPQFATMIMNCFAIDGRKEASGYINFWNIKEELKKWCESNCSNYWYCDSNHLLKFHFLSKNDMFLFKLKFDGSRIEA